MKQFNGFMHGVNLGGWFSQCNHTAERYDNFIKEEDFKTIADIIYMALSLRTDKNALERQKERVLEITNKIYYEQTNF